MRLTRRFFFIFAHETHKYWQPADIRKRFIKKYTSEEYFKEADNINAKM